MGVQNIIDNQGVSLVITGMTIVFLALVMVSILIALLPKILAVLLPPESAEPAHGHPAHGHPAHGHSAHGHSARTRESSDEALVAAIGVALHRRLNRK